MEITLKERLQSLKAGGLAAIAFTGIYGSSVAIHVWRGETEPIISLINIGSALLSGFLFGVTYRYIIRNDANPHLRDGAVLAFTLVRSSGLLEGLQSPLTEGFSLLLGLMESFIGFAIARSCLDFALARQWLAPFGSER